MQLELLEYRELTLAEIASAAKSRRELLGMKQVTLAHKAGVAEKTVQRIENGVKVDDNSLTYIAIALGLNPNSFLGPRTIRSFEETGKSFEHFFENCEIQPVMPVKDWSDMQELLSCAAVATVTNGIGIDAKEVTAELNDFVGEALDFVDLCSSTELVDLAKTAFSIVERISTLGVAVNYAVSKTDVLAMGAILCSSKGSESAKQRFTVFPKRFELFGSALDDESERIAAYLLDILHKMAPP